eukprot:SAG11_NODE_451_length_9386_cov_42.557661_9_plen_128_part_00
MPVEQRYLSFKMAASMTENLVHAAIHSKIAVERQRQAAAVEHVRLEEERHNSLHAELETTKCVPRLEFSPVSSQSTVSFGSIMVLAYGSRVPAAGADLWLAQSAHIDSPRRERYKAGPARHVAQDDQ